MAISLNSVNSEVVRAHKRIDGLGGVNYVNYGVNLKNSFSINMIVINNAVLLSVTSSYLNNHNNPFVIFDIPREYLPKAEILGTGTFSWTTGEYGSWYRSGYASLLPDGSVTAVANNEGDYQIWNGVNVHMYFMYTI